MTEQVTGVDLVEWMVRGAAGDCSFMDGRRASAARALRSRRASTPRIPAIDYRPSAGRLTEVAFPRGRAGGDLGGHGTEVSAYYDPLLAKLIVTAEDRRRAVARAASGARRSAAGRDRDQPGLAARGRRRRRRSSPVRSSTDLLARRPSARRDDLGPERRAGDDRAGLSRPPRLLGRRRAAVGPDGRAGVPARQPPARQSRGAAGLEFTAQGPTPASSTASAQSALTGADIGATLDGGRSLRMRRSRSRAARP